MHASEDDSETQPSVTKHVSSDDNSFQGYLYMMVQTQETAEGAMKVLDDKTQLLCSIKEELDILSELGDKHDAFRTSSQLVLKLKEPLQQAMDKLRETEAQGDAFMSFLYAAMNKAARQKRHKPEPWVKLDHRWTLKSFWDRTKSMESSIVSTESSLKYSHRKLMWGEHDLDCITNALESAQERNESALRTLKTGKDQLASWLETFESTETAFELLKSALSEVKECLRSMIHSDEAINDNADDLSDLHQFKKRRLLL